MTDTVDEREGAVAQADAAQEPTVDSVEAAHSAFANDLAELLSGDEAGDGESAGGAVPDASQEQPDATSGTPASTGFDWDSDSNPYKKLAEERQGVEAELQRIKEEAQKAKDEADRKAKEDAAAEERREFQERLRWLTPDQRRVVLAAEQIRAAATNLDERERTLSEKERKLNDGMRAWAANHIGQQNDVDPELLAAFDTPREMTLFAQTVVEERKRVAEEQRKEARKERAESGADGFAGGGTAASMAQDPVPTTWEEADKLFQRDLARALGLST